MRSVVYFSNNDWEEVEDSAQSSFKTFSLVQDLRIKKFPIKRQFRLLIQEYSKYVLTKKSTLDKEVIDQIDEMLVSKFNVFINRCEQDILENKFLDIVLGIVEPDLKKAANKFTRIYKRMLITRNKLGYIPREMQSRIDDAYKVMIGELRNVVFNPVLNLFSFEPGDLPSEGSHPELDILLQNGNPELAQLREYILGIYKNKNLKPKIVIDSNKLIMELI